MYRSSNEGFTVLVTFMGTVRPEGQPAELRRQHGAASGRAGGNGRRVLPLAEPRRRPDHRELRADAHLSVVRVVVFVGVVVERRQRRRRRFGHGPGRRWRHRRRGERPIRPGPHLFRSRWNLPVGAFSSVFMTRKLKEPQFYLHWIYPDLIQIWELFFIPLSFTGLHFTETLPNQITFVVTY